MRASIAESAIDAVIDRYRQMIYGIALTHTRNLHDAEDAFQQTFLIYLEKNPVIRDEEHRKAWLIRTAIHCCRKITGSTWRKKTVPLDDAPEASFTFASRAENDVYQAVRALQRGVFVLLRGRIDRGDRVRAAYFRRGGAHAAGAGAQAVKIAVGRRLF